MSQHSKIVFAKKPMKPKIFGKNFSPKKNPESLPNFLRKNDKPSQARLGKIGNLRLSEAAKKKKKGPQNVDIWAFSLSARSPNKKSSGHGGISNEILKYCSPLIDPILAKNFIESFQKSTYPTWLVLAKITTLFKKRDRSRPENYRPMSLIFHPVKYLRNFVDKNFLFWPGT